MYCPACGREIPPGTATCGFCGTALGPFAEPPPPPPGYRASLYSPPPGSPPAGPPPIHSGPGRLWLFFTLGVVTAAVIAGVVVLVAKVVSEDTGATAAPTTTVAPSTTAETTTTTPPTTTTTSAPTTSTTGVPGMTWSRSPAGEDVLGVFASRSGIAAGGPGVVAVGWDWSEGDSDAALWTSSDGVTWSRVTHDEAVFGGPGEQALNAVAGSGTGLVAVGADLPLGGDWAGAVWTSVDGLAWSRVPHDESVFGGPGDQMILAVTPGGPGWVAVGFDGIPDNRSAAVWTSSDGLTWSRVPHDEVSLGGPGDQMMVAVAAAGPGLVAVGIEEQPAFRAAAVWVSLDGLVWERVPHDAAAFGGGSINAWMSAVAAGGPGLVAVGVFVADADDPDSSAAAVWTSTDGSTWSRVADDEAVLGGPGRQSMLGITAGASVLVATGVEETDTALRAAVWFSVDGLTWSRVPHEEAVFGGPAGEGMLGVAAVGSGFVGVGANSVWVGNYPG